MTLALASVVGALAVPGAVEARTFCVATTAADCDQAGYTANGAGLQAALVDSHNYVDINGPNTVRIGPGLYERAGGFSVEDPVHVIGSGPATVVGATDNQVPIQAIGGAGASLGALTVRVATSTVAGTAGFFEVTDVRVTGSGTPTWGVQLRAGGRATRVTVDPAGIGSIGIDLVGSGTIEDSLVVVRSGNAAAFAVRTLSQAAPGVVRHVTALGLGAGPSATGVLVASYRNPTTSAYARGVVRDSVVRGLATSLRRSVSNSSTPCTGCLGASADLTASYSSFAAATVASAGSEPGTLTLAPGNLDDPDPLFTDPAPDLRLRAGSPLIDKGDPAGLQSGEPAVDLGGSPRVIGGRSDIGAFEAPLAAPIGPLAPASVLDTTAPALSRQTLSRKRFRVARASTPVAAAARVKRKKKPGRGTTLAYTLSEPATVTLKVERKLRGRKVTTRRRTRCVTETRKNRKKKNKRCALYRKAGTLTRKGGAGRRRLKLSGRIGKRALRPGSYRLTLTARDAAGNTGKPRGLAFTVVK